MADTLRSSWHAPILNMRKFWIHRALKSAIYSYTGFLIKCPILDIRQGSEYASISEYTKVLNAIEF